MAAQQPHMFHGYHELMRQVSLFMGSMRQAQANMQYAASLLNAKKPK